MKLGSGKARRLFYERVVELGGHVVEPAWKGLREPHRVVCAEGHEVTPSPISVVRGRGICRVCARKDPHSAERAFLERIIELGGRVIETEWLGCMAPHRVLCKEGHECRTRPNGVQQRHGFCRTCAGNDTVVAEMAFRQRVAELGGRIVEPEWRGTHQPHRVICSSGHLTRPRPSDVLKGHGPCSSCSHRNGSADVFYVVSNSSLNRTKLGVTFGDAKHRLRSHRRAGYQSVIRKITAMADAADLERTVLATLRLAEIAPIQGREYYDISALPVILDVADHWPVA